MAASASGSPVVCLDPAEYLTLWPIFGSRLREELPRVALLLALPLTPAGAGQPIGAIDLVRHTPWEHGEEPLAGATAAARAIADILLWRALHHFGGLQPLPWQPADLVDAHWCSAQRAAGLLAARHDIPVPDALALLRARAFATGRPLPQVCSDLLNSPEQ
ncbi:ANTAR domain-containing protein [Streptomyces sp. SGAir0957]